MSLCLKSRPIGAVWSVVSLAGALALFAGCKTDVHHSLLERELRLQEDQIYGLQDKLQTQCYELDQLADENASLRRQLGIVDAGPGGAARPPARTPQQLPTPAAPLLVPPAVEVPALEADGPADDGPQFGSPASQPAGKSFPSSQKSAPSTPVPGQLAPPTIEGVPPLPQAENDRAAGRSVRQLSFVESVAGQQQLHHLVINRDKTLCYDADGDGRSEGLTLVVEPRDADERLVTTSGDLEVTVYAPPQSAQQTDAGSPLAHWSIPAAEAMNHFRRTSRARGLHFVLPWPTNPLEIPQVQVQVRLTRFDGSPLETKTIAQLQSAATTAGIDPLTANSLTN
jgi:hypothetical protein